MNLSLSAATRLEGLNLLPSISLDDLTASAGLMTRIDRKYLLVPGRHDHVVPSLVDEVLVPGAARVLQIGDTRAFGYRSDYLDTAESDSLLGAARGRRRRFKVRLRTYLDTGEVNLEVKTRGGRGSTVKERLPFDGPVLLGDGAQARLSLEAAEYVAQRLDDAGVFGVDPTHLRPSLTTLYRRTTLLLPHSGSRLTIDSDLEFRTPEGTVRGTDGLLVVETKTPTGGEGVRAEADRHLWAQGVRPARFSKYGTGRVLLDPTLPANRWHRTITRDLTPSELS